MQDGNEAAEAAEHDTTTATATATDERSPEQIAADAALARADRPPPSLGGPPEDDAAADDGEAAAERHSLAARLADADRPDIEVVEDTYLESREAVANGTPTDDDLTAVTEWLLSDEVEVNSRKLMVRYGGSDDDPKVTPWFIRAIGVDTIRSAEREAAGNRQSRRQQQGYDELKANLRIVVEGTAMPDLKRIAREKGLADATILIQRKFSYRPGAIAQIAGEIMALSGFDSEDVRAAGNF